MGGRSGPDSSTVFVSSTTGGFGENQSFTKSEILHLVQNFVIRYTCRKEKGHLVQETIGNIEVSSLTHDESPPFLTLVSTTIGNLTETRLKFSQKNEIHLCRVTVE